MRVRVKTKGGRCVTVNPERAAQLVNEGGKILGTDRPASREESTTTPRRRATKTKES